MLKASSSSTRAPASSIVSRAAASAAVGAPAVPAYRPPRTAWGAPDLRGVWSNLSLTHLERPPGVAGAVVAGASALTTVTGRRVHPR